MKGDFGVCVGQLKGPDENRKTERRKIKEEEKKRKYSHGFIQKQRTPRSTQGSQPSTYCPTLQPPTRLPPTFHLPAKDRHSKELSLRTPYMYLQPHSPSPHPEQSLISGSMSERQTWPSISCASRGKSLKFLLLLSTPTKGC